MEAGDIAAYSYIPYYDVFDGKGRLDGKDVKIYYHNGTANVAVPQVLLPMGTSASKVLFALQKPIGASVPYQLNENTNAGSTSYASLPAGTRLAFDGSDDADTQITLPFNFPFKTGTTNKLLVAIDGYVVPDGDPAGNYLRYDLDSLSNAVSKAFIAPWLSDFSIWGPTQGVWADIQPSQVTIRWEVQPSTGGDVLDVIAKFALILKPDGSIRFVYGSPCTQDSVAISYSPPKYGVGAGDAVFSKVTEPGFEDYANHADITYTQTFGAPVESTGYWLYYGNPGDDGKTGRTPPPASKLVRYDFDDNTDQGWIPVIQNPTLSVSNGVMQFTALNGGDHPSAFASGQTTVLGDQFIIAKMKSSGGDNEIGIMGRAGAFGQGYALLLDAYGSQELIVARTGESQANDYGIISNGVPYGASSNLWHFAMMKITGTGPDIAISGKAFNELQTETPNWSVTATVRDDSRSDRRFDTGALGFTFWEGGGNKPYLDWVVVCDPKVEGTSGATGDEQENPNVGLVTGKVSFGNVGVQDATLTFTPSGGGAPQSTTTDAAGLYTVALPGGGYNLSVTSVWGCFDPYSGAVTVTVGQTQTLNVALAAKANMVENASFEEEDSQFSGKPRGWFRRSYGGIASPTADNCNTDLAPWIYRKDMGRTGTHCIGFEGTTGDIQSWEVESSAVGTVNPDQRGGAALPRLPVGATIKYSFWYKKATGAGEVRHRPRYCRADDVNLLIAGGASNAATAAASDWTYFEGTYANTDPAAASYPHFLAYRVYGVNNPAGGPVYVDDVVVTLVSLPSTKPPKTYRGYVQDSKGNRIPNVVVGLGDGTTNALAAPYQTYYTDGVGRFTFTITDFSKNWYVQARQYRLVSESNPFRGGRGSTVIHNTIASPDIPLPSSTVSPVVITYDPEPAVNIAAGAPLAVADANAPVDAVAHWAVTEDDLFNWSSVYHDVVLGGPCTLTDNDIWSSAPVDGGDIPGGRKYPRFIIVDLGREVTFGTGVKQIQYHCDPAPAQGLQIRVSKTPPPKTFTGYSQTDYLNSPCLTWGTPVFISPNGIPLAGSAQPDPGDENRVYLQFEDNYQRVRTITRFLTNPDGSPVSGRYVMLLMLNSKWNVSTYELLIETTAGVITGQVVDTAGAPVADAFVGVHPTGLAYARTDASGRYSLSVPAAGPMNIQAHKAPDAATVYPLSSMEAVTPVPGATVAAPTLVIGGATANVIPAGSVAYADPSLEDEGYYAVNTVDGDLTTRWRTPGFTQGTVSLLHPLAVNIDMGAPRTINQVVVHWESAWARGYRIVVTDDSNPQTTETPSFVTSWGTGGYFDGVRYVDAVQFPAKTGRYLNIVVTCPGPVNDRLSAWEIEAANVTPPAPSVARVLRIVAGLETATAADVTAFDVVKTGASSGKITLEDAVKLLRARSGL
jgi:hypothetical protein